MSSKKEGATTGENIFIVLCFFFSVIAVGTIVYWIYSQPEYMPSDAEKKAVKLNSASSEDYRLTENFTSFESAKNFCAGLVRGYGLVGKNQPICLIASSPLNETVMVSFYYKNVESG